jgi:hypothetical protein
MQALKVTTLQVFNILVVILGSADACHVLPLSEESFGGNILHLLHAVAIYEGSGGGDFLVDQRKFPYRCMS